MTVCAGMYLVLVSRSRRQDRTIQPHIGLAVSMIYARDGGFLFAPGLNYNDNDFFFITAAEQPRLNQHYNTNRGDPRNTGSRAYTASQTQPPPSSAARLVRWWCDQARETVHMVQLGYTSAVS